MMPLKAATASAFERPPRLRICIASSPIRTLLSPGLGLVKIGATAQAWVGEQPAVRLRERAQVRDPVVGGRRRLEAAQHAIQQRGDQLLLGREVVVERHRHRLQPRRDRAHREPVEALLGDAFGRFEDDARE